MIWKPLLLLARLWTFSKFSRNSTIFPVQVLFGPEFQCVPMFISKPNIFRLPGTACCKWFGNYGPDVWIWRSRLLRYLVSFLRFVFRCWSTRISLIGCIFLFLMVCVADWNTPRYLWITYLTVNMQSCSCSSNKWFESYGRTSRGRSKLWKWEVDARSILPSDVWIWPVCSGSTLPYGSRSPPMLHTVLRY